MDALALETADERADVVPWYERLALDLLASVRQLAHGSVHSLWDWAGWVIVVVTDHRKLVYESGVLQHVGHALRHERNLAIAAPGKIAAWLWAQPAEGGISDRGKDKRFVIDLRCLLAGQCRHRACRDDDIDT